MESKQQVEMFMQKKYIKPTYIENATSYFDAGEKFLEKISLSEVQKKSFDKFIKEVIPFYLGRKYSDRNNRCEISFSDWYIDYSNTRSEENCREYKLSYEADLVANVVIKINPYQNLEGFTVNTKLIIEKIPLISKNGGVIIGGTNKSLVSHLEENNSVRLEDIINAKTKAKTLKFKTSLRTKKETSTLAYSFKLEYNGKDIFANIGSVANIDPIEKLIENIDSIDIAGYQEIIGNSTEMVTKLMSLLEYESGNALSLKIKGKSNGKRSFNEDDIHTILSKFYLKYDERVRLNKKLSLSSRAIDRISYNDIYINDKLICKKGDVLNLDMIKTIESTGMDIYVCSRFNNNIPIKIITNKFVLIEEANEILNLLETIPKSLEGRQVSIEVLKELVELSQNGNSLDELIANNTDRLLGTSLNFSDYVSLINLFGQFLSKEVDPEDSTSLETKSLISISEIYEEEFLKKFPLGFTTDTFNLPASIYDIIDKTYLQCSKIGAEDINTEFQTKFLESLKTGLKLKTISSFLATHKLFNIDDTTSPFAQASLKGKISQQQVEGRGGSSQQSSNISTRTINPSFMGRIDLQETSEGSNVGLVRFLTTFATLDTDGSIMAPFFIVDRENKKIDYTKVYYLTYENEKVLTRAIAPVICKEDKVIISFFNGEGNKVDKLEFNTHYTPELDIPIDGVNYKKIADDFVKEHNLDSYEISYQRKDWFEDENRISCFKGHGEVHELTYKDIDIVSVRPDHLLSPSSASTPFIRHNDSARQMMGNNHSKQAISILNPDAPYITTEVAKKITDSLFGTIKSPVSGIVKLVEAKQIIIESFDKNKGDMTEVVVPLIRGFETNISTQLYSIPTVNPGDIVIEGDLIASNNMANKDGLVTHGKHLTMAIMPMYGKNYEDSILISDRLLKENLFTSTHIKEYRFTVDTSITEKCETGETAIKQYPYDKKTDITITQDVDTKYRKSFDADGMVFKNSVIEPNQPILVFWSLIGKNFKGSNTATYMAVSEKYDSHVPGVVVYTRKEVSGSKTTFVIKISSIEEINPGDKMSGRHGNKGVVSTIMPEADMPFDQETGKRMDIVFNPLGIPSRMNIGQLIELQLTPILKAYNLRAELVPSDFLDMDIFKKMIAFHRDKDGNLTDKVQLCDGLTGEPYENLSTVGITYFIKSKHQADHKIASRSYGAYNIYGQPPRGKKMNGGQKSGQMELWSLAEHGVDNLIYELLALKSDDTGSREIFRKYNKAIIQAVKESEDDTLPLPNTSIIKDTKDLRNVPFTQKLVNAIFMSSFIYPRYTNENDDEINSFINCGYLDEARGIKNIDRRLKKLALRNEYKRGKHEAVTIKEQTVDVIKDIKSDNKPNITSVNENIYDL